MKAADFKLAPVVRKGQLNEIDEAMDDLLYWISRPASERIAAVTFLISQSLADGETMDKSIIRKKRLKRI
jgi:hypothetical protein